MNLGRKYLLLTLLIFVVVQLAQATRTRTSLLLANQRITPRTDNLVSNQLHRIRGGSTQRNTSRQPQSILRSSHHALFVFQSASFMTILSSTLVAFAPASTLVTKLSSDKATSILSILSAGTAVLEIITSPFIGSLLDTRGRKPVFLAILIATAVSQGIVVITSASIWSLCICKVVVTLCAGLFFQIIGQAILSDLVPDRLSSALGTQSALAGAGFFVAALGGGQLMSKFGLSVTYAVAAILTLMNLTLIALALPETLECSSLPRLTKKKKNFFSPLLACTRILTRHKQPIPILAFVIVLQRLPSVMGDFFQIYFTQEWNLDTQAFINFIALIGILGIIANGWGSILVRQLGVQHYTVLTSLLSILPSIGASTFGFSGLLTGHLTGFLGMAQSLGVTGAIVAKGKQQGIPVGELAGETASLIALVKVIGPIFYSSLYIQGQRLLNTPNLPFLFNALLGVAVSGICNVYM